jgi:hypothetical protein
MIPRARPSTAKPDEVQRAACYLARAVEIERLLRYAIAPAHQREFSDLAKRALIASAKQDRANAERAARGEPITEHDLHRMQWRRKYGDRYGWPLSPTEAAGVAHVEEARCMSLLKQTNNASRTPQPMTTAPTHG